MLKLKFLTKKFPLLRPIIATFLILVLYQILIWGQMIPPDNGINRFQTNTIKAERYVYDINPNLELAIVGSSLADSLNAEDIGENVANLGMAGGSAQTGLAIIQKTTFKPPLVLVEINSTIDRTIDENLINHLFHSFWGLVRQTLPIFRQEYRPVKVLAAALSGSNQPTIKTREDFQNNPFRQQQIQGWVAQNTSLVSEEYAELLQQQAAIIKTQIEALEAAGSRVILFELPVEAEIQATPRYQQVNKILRSLFPRDRYEWLPQPQRDDWITSDGLHLIYPDAQEYAAFVGEQLLTNQ